MSSIIVFEIYIGRTVKDFTSPFSLRSAKALMLTCTALSRFLSLDNMKALLEGKKSGIPDGVYFRYLILKDHLNVQWRSIELKPKRKTICFYKKLVRLSNKEKIKYSDTKMINLIFLCCQMNLMSALKGLLKIILISKVNDTFPQQDDIREMMEPAASFDNPEAFRILLSAMLGIADKTAIISTKDNAIPRIAVKSIALDTALDTPIKDADVRLSIVKYIVDEVKIRPVLYLLQSTIERKTTTCEIFNYLMSKVENITQDDRNEMIFKCVCYNPVLLDCFLEPGTLIPDNMILNEDLILDSSERFSKMVHRINFNNRAIKRHIIEAAIVPGIVDMMPVEFTQDDLRFAMEEGGYYAVNSIVTKIGLPENPSEEEMLTLMRSLDVNNLMKLIPSKEHMKIQYFTALMVVKRPVARVGENLFGITPGTEMDTFGYILKVLGYMPDFTGIEDKRLIALFQTCLFFEVHKDMIMTLIPKRLRKKIEDKIKRHNTTFNRIREQLLRLTHR